MKNMKLLLSAVVTVLIFTACSSTQSTSSSTQKKHSGRDYSVYTNLADILRKYPGIQISGTGNSTIVQIRGMNSLMLDTRPLYVIDGTIIGRDYARANESINTADIGSVRIIKNLTELNKYGEQGRNGVIYIRSKK